MTSAPAIHRVSREAAALELREISAGYGRASVLRNVSLRVEPGSVAALLGPNGAGKTTLLRVAAGLLRNTAGSVVMGGADCTTVAAFKRRRDGLCLIPEGRGIFANLTVRENLHLQVSHRERPVAVDRVLAVFPALRDRLSQAAGTLSGGEQQMLALGRCYLQDSKVVLVDEVSMGLAPLVVDEVFEALSGLRHDGVALLLVEQHVDRALELADTVFVLNRGEIARAGASAQIDRDELLRQYLGAGDVRDAGTKSVWRKP